MVNLPKPATEPTMYFIGVTTGQSSIMRIFPIWAKALGIQATLKGIDIAIHAPAEDYRAVMEFIRSDPLSMGALVTTHKIDLLNACRDLFDELDPYARSRQGSHLGGTGAGFLPARGILAGASSGAGLRAGCRR